ncbi:MAG: CoA ester lyase [Pseudomonadota bacterium]
MWRSLLFVPTLAEKFVAKAASRGADAIILDLEASIDADRKEEARSALPGAVAALAPKVKVTVRINPLWRPTLLDLEACVIKDVAAIHVALCGSAEHLRAVDGIVSELEAARGLPQGQIKLIAMIETADALSQAVEIAKATPRLAGLTLGVEDYATSMGVSATPDLLRPAVFLLNQAARSAGLHSWAVPVSVADYQDTETLKAQAQYARALGTTGGYAVHPRQVEVLNAVFSATEEELSWAKEVVKAAAEAKEQGKAVFKVQGQMIDLPLITRAERILADHPP